MSRSQKQVRRAGGGSPQQGGDTGQYPEGVTQKNGATNVAGDVNRFSADQYQGTVVVSDDND